MKSINNINQLNKSDFLIQRVGGGAGIVTKDMNKKEPAYYNIKASDEVYNVFKKIIK